MYQLPSTEFHFPTLRGSVQVPRAARRPDTTRLAASSTRASRKALARRVSRNTRQCRRPRRSSIVASEGRRVAALSAPPWCCSPCAVFWAAPRGLRRNRADFGGRDSCLGFAGTKVRVGGRGASRARRDRDVASRRSRSLTREPSKAPSLNVCHLRPARSARTAPRAASRGEWTTARWGRCLRTTRVQPEDATGSSGSTGVPRSPALRRPRRASRGPG